MAVFNWSEDAVEILRVMAAERHSSAEIAAALSRHSGYPVTRNAVIGKAHRISVTLCVSKSEKTQRPKLPRRPPPAILPTPKPIVRPDAVVGTVNAVMGLNWAKCRWPLSDPQKEDFHFCCAPVSLEQTYCAEHRAVAYLPKPARKPRNQRNGQWTTLAT